VLRRLHGLFGGSLNFLIHFEPAPLYGPWFRDSDAVHWVSLWDLKRWLPEDAVMRPLRIGASGLRGRFWARFLCCLFGYNICNTRRHSGNQSAKVYEA
jgi:hypothetical protein